MLNFYFIIILLSLNCQLGFLEPDIIWKPNTDISNNANWESGAIPCYEDRIIFPHISKAQIGINIKKVVTDISLPYSGEIVFYQGAELIFSEAPTDQTTNCHGHDAIYNRTSPLSWFNPINWNRVKTKPYQMLLDAEKIPNRYDIVQFPKKSSFFVSVNSAVSSIFVKKFIMRQQTFTRSRSLRQYLDGGYGQKEIVKEGTSRVPTISITNKDCYLSGECILSTLATDVKKTICSYVTCPTTFKCRYPVVAQGNCCPFCGAVITMMVQKKFDVSHVRTMINQYIGDNALFSLVRTSQSQVQGAFFVKDSSSHSFHDTIMDIVKRLESGYAIDSIDMKIYETSSVLHWSRLNGSVRGIIIGVIVLFVLAVTILAVYFGCRERYTRGEISITWVSNWIMDHRPQPASWLRRFAPWNRPTRLDESGLAYDDRFGGGVFSGDVIELPDNSISFDNPIYDGEEEERRKAAELVSDVMEETSKTETEFQIENVTSSGSTV